MKNKLKLVIALAFIASATTFAQKKEIKTAESTINWTGKKVTGSHTGTLNLSQGFFTFEGNNITGGEFTVDMTTLAVTDLKAEEGKGKLEGHLNSDDFFGVEKHKTAKLVIKKATKLETGYAIEGELTIKGKTHPTRFSLSVNKDSATAKLKVDRTKYGIKYGSGSFFDNLGDKTISDEFELVVNIKM